MEPEPAARLKGVALRAQTAVGSERLRAVRSGGDRGHSGLNDEVARLAHNNQPPGLEPTWSMLNNCIQRRIVVFKSTRNAPALLMACAMVLGPCSLCFAQRAAPVESLLEMRHRNAVIQQWDLSCGAAALATILRYQHGDPITEREIAIGMMSREEYLENPLIVSFRQGFSLLDLKRFVDARGYEGIGLGQLSLESLSEYAPIIVPISLFGYQHFVVYRGLLGNRVLLADPAFGNRTMSKSQFERTWLGFPGIGRVGFYVQRRDGLFPPNKLEPSPVDYVTIR